MNNAETANALLKSDAYKSLSIEAEVFDIVCKYFPKASLSPYFTDIDTGKMREIDITALVRYKKNKEKPIFCNLYFFIECKSNKSFNIIASGQDLSIKSYVHDCIIWPGEDANNRFEKSRKILATTSLNNNQISTCIEVLKGLFFPNETRRTLKVEPTIFSSISSYSSFRETNIKDEKDIDNSVLWRAFQSLTSAQKSYGYQVWKTYEESILNYGEYKANKRLYMTEFALEDIVDFSATNVDIIQKIVVIDSPLWKRVNDNNIETLKYFRLLRQRIDSFYIDFVDVVNRQYFSEYMKAVNEHYKRCQKEMKLERIF